MSFPVHRPRRLRRTERLRSLVRESRLTTAGLLYPMFVCTGTKTRHEVSSMPGIFQQSADQIVEECREVEALGLPGVILFGLPEYKDPHGGSSLAADGVVQRAVEAIKKANLDLLVITDVCLCEYTDHGHCGVIEDGEVANDPTLEILSEQALSHARAGADLVAPSDMMDGRVAAIRQKLDKHGFENVAILSYAAKYCSGFYGPFREAAQSAPKAGDRSSYQMDPGNGREALLEVSLDLEEGADVIMVKPALAYLDVIRAVRERFDVPVAAYNVSGEFSMVKAAAANGWIDEKRVVLEILTGIQRAGASVILSYHAKEVVRWLNEGSRSERVEETLSGQGKKRDSSLRRLRS
jgi:porphobilinogen synthase